MSKKELRVSSQPLVDALLINSTKTGLYISYLSSRHVKVNITKPFFAGAMAWVMEFVAPVSMSGELNVYILGSDPSFNRTFIA